VLRCFTIIIQAYFLNLYIHIYIYTQCYSDIKETRNASCPVCQEWFNTLARPLPFAHCSQSRLFCSISGLPLNEHNTPMILPNGYVYGEQVYILCTYYFITNINKTFFTLGFS